MKTTAVRLSAACGASCTFPNTKGFLAAEEYHQPFSKLYPHSPVVEHYRTISRFLTDPLNRSNTSALQVINEMESEAKDDTQDLQPP